MATAMRAKLRVSSIEKFETSEKLRFSAVSKSDGYSADGSDENNSFARWTPMANFEMLINNPELVGKNEVGDEFYVDFTPVVKQ